ncbi:MAG: MFS transporter, partial [Acidobacteria bacterium]|nr:MFS transporter [Acidobacteriota bacterium]NIM60993.1 MFS transporter [Acidobacteriota bacterium]NIO59961.1 MFS transporter [Acidobacteriota bacterium]NIQ31033.1 MFS transporter [Acidobacteriota bacterium]NIQ86161.1 MFS transporter [Acidobacteriota bacterium]
EVSTPRTIGRVSAWSWGTGFIGGLLALVACGPLISRPLIPVGATELDPDAVTAWRWSFVLVAIFFALFSVFTFVYLRERAQRGAARDDSYLAIGWRRVAQTVTHLREHREAGKYVLAYMFFFGGIATVIIFAAIYAKDTFQIEEAELFRLFVFTNVAAFPGTLLAGYIADWLGTKRALVLTLIGWILLLFWGAQAGSTREFWVLAMGISVGVGATQAIGRAFMARLCPDDRRSEFFGYYMMAGRIGAVLSMPLFGLVSSVTGNQRLAVLWLVPLFVVGLGFVLRVREPKAS